MKSSRFPISWQRFSMVATVALAAACADDAPPEPATYEAAVTRSARAGSSARLVTIERAHVADDLYHYVLDVAVGDTPHARLRLHRLVRERAPWRPRPTTDAVLLMHGDFATFASNFAPVLNGGEATGGGLAVALARGGLDVWGLDRRSTLASADATAEQRADFAEMGLATALDDVGRALAIVRTARGLGGDGWDPITLGGFSRGGFLAYAYAAREGARPAWQRQVDALVPIDVYAAIAPEDEAARASACARRDEERAAIAAGEPAGDQRFFGELGTLAEWDPQGASPLFPGLDNRGALLAFAAQTYFFFPATPHYHQAGAVLEDGMPVSLRFSPEPRIADWLIAAPPWGAQAELADVDGIWCGDEGAVDLGAIEVPVYHLGAAGGFGEHARFTTDQLGSADVTVHVVSRLEPSQLDEDVGHADLLFAGDAPALAWTALGAWIAAH